MTRFLWFLCCCFAVVQVAGCGNASGLDTPPLCEVKGLVTLDGKPLAEGEIMFELIGPGQFTLPVKDGSFSGKAYAGKNSVQIRVYKDGPPLDTDPSGPATRINILPARYNDETTLSADVTPEGANEFKFPVTSR